ncbi:hypothetical protein [Mycoplasmopsis columbina]|uniref:hypothetical protein n=1 Tax=Mycoplasmopsis columbina TaxID=114881 RepID=UPI0004A72B13|nr:hypothetical protein [Mycoplasmopsis columbina]VEU76870.1 Uncharacterised protein [Mycoplasmopsis columbina]
MKKTKIIKNIIYALLNILLVISFVFILLPDQFVDYHSAPGEPFITPSYYSFIFYTIDRTVKTYINVTIILVFFYTFISWIIFYVVLRIINKKNNPILKLVENIISIAFIIALIVIMKHESNDDNIITELGYNTYEIISWTIGLFMLKNICEIVGYVLSRTKWNYKLFIKQTFKNYKEEVKTN